LTSLSSHGRMRILLSRTSPHDQLVGDAVVHLLCTV
jgi:hypothetical protein